MLNKPLGLNRTGLNTNQIKAIQKILGASKTVVDVPMGDTYGEFEVVAKIGEDLTKQFTSNFLPKANRVFFLLLESEISNAYAYWMNSFDAVCITTAMAREIQFLCANVASHLVYLSNKRSSFAYIHDVNLTPEEITASLEFFLIQGVMTVLVGHEVGHLSAGHKPFFLSNAAGSMNEESASSQVVADEFFAASKATIESPGERALLFNAHELDADMQGFRLTSIYWKLLQKRVRSLEKVSREDMLIRATCEEQGQLLLLASTGAVIALSLLGFKEFKPNWRDQPTHPITSVRCILGLTVLANILNGEESEISTGLELDPRCIEAILLVHSRLGSILLEAARLDGNYSDVAKSLYEAHPSKRLEIMLLATGVHQAINIPTELLIYIDSLSNEFLTCENQRQRASSVQPESLLQWAAVTRDA